MVHVGGGVSETPELLILFVAVRGLWIILSSVDVTSCAMAMRNCRSTQHSQVGVHSRGCFPSTQYIRILITSVRAGQAASQKSFRPSLLVKIRRVSLLVPDREMPPAKSVTNMRTDISQHPPSKASLKAWLVIRSFELLSHSHNQYEFAKASTRSTHCAFNL